MTDLDRLFAKCTPEPNSGCWLWTGALSRIGYSSFRFRGTTQLGHRVSYILHRGEIPDDLEIDHLCCMRCCVNPEHLEVVTRAQNINRSPRTLPKVRRAQTHCRYGHLFDAANTYRTKAGKRVCRICARDRMRGYRAEKV